MRVPILFLLYSISHSSTFANNLAKQSTVVPMAAGHRTFHICSKLVLDSPSTLAIKITLTLSEYTTKAIIQLSLWVLVLALPIDMESIARRPLCTSFLNIFCLPLKPGLLGEHPCPRPGPLRFQNPFLSFRAFSASLCLLQQG